MRDKAYTIFSLRKRNSQSKQLEWYPHPCNFLGNRIATTRIVVTGTTGVPSDEWHKTAALYSFVVECDAIYLTQTNTVSCSDASIAPLVTSTARQLTGLAAAVPSRSMATDERGNATETWTAVNGSIVTRHRRVPYATNVAETTLRYGDVVREVSVSGVTDTYAYDALGRQISHTDGRGGMSHTEYNALGLRSASIDALGNRTAYAYDRYGNISAVTNPLGNAVVYEYDLRGRRTYEGGATYPVRYTYDVFGNKTTMTTYRNESLGPTSGDLTTWRYDEASNCMTNKVYADGKGPRYGYTQDGKLSQRIWARGIVTDYSYDGWGSLTNTVYSDGTPTVTLLYDAMGRQTNAVDAAGVTTFGYDDFGSLTNETVVGAAGENTIIRHWDVYGRTAGYTLNTVRQTTIGYDAVTGRIATMLANGSNVPFIWSYLPGSDLKSSLAYPNGLTASWTYDANGQLLQVRNAVVATAPSPSETEVISQYDYVYDNAGRRVSCTKSGSSFTQNDALSYGYNEKSELTNAVAAVNSGYHYVYDFDDIGNREAANERGTNAVYMANQLNQYTAVDDFTPQFDDDGNQTLVKTTTGVWSVAYNGENRPVLWTGGTTNIVMKYDRMGRRVEYLETVGGSPSSVTVTNAHHRFVYDGYLCVQRLNAAANNAVDIAFGWDPTEPVATRPLWMQRVSGSYNFFYFHDGNKNVSDLVSYQSARGVPAHYEYAPFGAVTEATTNTAFTAFNVAATNPYRFSSEYADDALGLVYYNYRHYNPLDGRWTSRDPVEDVSQYSFLWNKATDIDVLGLFDKDVHYYYTYLYLEMLRRAGISVGNLAEIARGAQAPDEYSRTSAYIGWIDSQALFHNLNGLDSCGVKCYRDCVYCLISNPTKEINDEFSKGLLLHVLGDTYAHTKEDGSAYPRIIGHSLKGTTPDNVRKQLGKFKQYASDLSRLFGDNMGIYESLVQEIETMLKHETLTRKTIDLYLLQTTYNRVGYTYSLEEILVELSNKLPDGALTIPEPTYNWGYGNANPDVGKIEEVRKKLKVCFEKAKKCSAALKR